MKTVVATILLLAASAALPTRSLASGCVAHAYVIDNGVPELFIAYNTTEFLDNGSRDQGAVVVANSAVYENAFTLVASDAFAEGGGYTAHEIWREVSRYNRCYTNQVSSIAYLYGGGTRSCFDISPSACTGPQPRPPLDNCPIVLDLALNGLHLSGPTPAVSFDINADGTPNEIAWTATNSDDAFLCLDRNGNGRIDDGTELFGYATPLANGQPAQVGFRALAEYDTPALGGNGDGIIDAHDAIFPRLCVWRDANRDGVSDAGEITPLSTTNLLSISTRYITTDISDTYGNQFRYVGWTSVRRPGGTAPMSWPAYDVVFASAPH